MLITFEFQEEDINCRTALHHAASRGISRQVAVLLAHGALPSHKDSQGATPLHFAAMRSFTSCVRLLYRANSLVVSLVYISIVCSNSFLLKRTVTLSGCPNKQWAYCFYVGSYVRCRAVFAHYA